MSLCEEGGVFGSRRRQCVDARENLIKAGKRSRQPQADQIALADYGHSVNLAWSFDQIGPTAKNEMNSLHQRTPAKKAGRICLWFFLFIVFPSAVLMALRQGDNLLNFAATLLVGTVFFVPLVFLSVWGIERIRLAWKKRSGAARPEHDSANDQYFETAGNEVVSGNLKPALWAKSLAGANGDESKAKAAYIKARVQELAEAKQSLVGESKTTDALPTSEHLSRPNPEKVQEIKPKLPDVAETIGTRSPAPARETELRTEGEKAQRHSQKLEKESAVGAAEVPPAASNEPSVFLRPVAPSLVFRFLVFIAFLFAVIGAVSLYKRSVQPHDSPVGGENKHAETANPEKVPEFNEAYYLLNRLYRPDDPQAVKDGEAKLLLKFQTLRTRAENGEAQAQDELGVEYEGNLLQSKLFLKGDWPESLKWYRRATEQKLPSAQYHLGRMYYFGRGVAKNYTEAYQLYQKAAEHDFADAQLAIAGMLYSGEGVSQDKTGAFKLYMKLATQGNATAQLCVGCMLNRGDGASQDVAGALTWFRKSAEQTNSQAACWLASIYDTGQGVSKDSTEAAKWYQQVGGEGYDKAQCRLGEMYYRGEGVPQDYERAVKCLKTSSGFTNVQAQYRLGLAAAEGKGLAQDANEAAKWYYEAASRGHPFAQAKLGQAYAAGSGVAKDCAEAYKWELLAVANGNTNAVQDLLAVAGQLTPEQISEAKRRVAQFISAKP